MNIEAIKTPIFREKQSLIEFLTRQLPKAMAEKTVVVVTSKIVALAEGRTVPFTTVAAKNKLIKQESQFAVKTKLTWLTIRNGVAVASAGIDESNGNGKLILLPKDAYRSAANIRARLMAHYAVRQLGVLITDSHLTPLRTGIVGFALGYAGFDGLREYRKTPDIFGKPLTLTRTNVADSLASAAVVVMGEGSERQPIAVIARSPAVFTNRLRRTELQINPRDDIYRPLFKKIGNATKPKVKKIKKI